MPASGAATFGRIVSGRGFAQGSFQPHDLPPATHGVPEASNQSSVEAWLQHAKLAKNMQLLSQDITSKGPLAFTGRHTLSPAGLLLHCLSVLDEAMTAQPQVPTCIKHRAVAAAHLTSVHLTSQRWYHCFSQMPCKHAHAQRTLFQV